MSKPSESPCIAGYSAQQNLHLILHLPPAQYGYSICRCLRKSTDMGATWQRVLLPSDRVNEISPEDTIKFSLQPSREILAGRFFKPQAFSVISRMIQRSMPAQQAVLTNQQTAE